MADLHFECSECRQPLEAPRDMAGEIIECPACRATIEVPDPRTKNCPFCSEEILLTAVKCKHCGEMLTATRQVSPSPPVPRRMPNVAKGEVMCPTCHYIGMPKRKAKESFLLGLILCLFWLLPGIIYFIFMSGYNYICPRCGVKIQKV